MHIHSKEKKLFCFYTQSSYNVQLSRKNPVSECDRKIDHKRKTSIYHNRQLTKLTTNLWQEWIKQTCLFPLYRTKCKTKKCYHQVFFHLTFSVVNTWTIYRAIGRNGTLLDFIISISRCLISAAIDSNDENQEPPQKERSGIRANQVSDDICYDEKTTGHFKLMVQLKDVNTLDALAEADSSARNAKLFFVLLAVNAFWSFMVRCLFFYT